MIYTIVFDYNTRTKDLTDNSINYALFIIQKNIDEIMMNLDAKMFIMKIVMTLVLEVVEIDKNNVYKKMALI